ncbi:hypothetical protein Pfo_025080 [Paulownia fortunei]|nr:hypothetical protein Pfo_025080 [Paulownia fortunei]
MSQAASGGGMKGSGDDNAGDKKGKGIAENPDSLPSSDGESDQDDQAEVESKATRRSTLDCLASLEESLPMKRGLSSHYTGRSKSFGNLTELGLEDVKDLEKKEHPVNKRRRLILAHEYYDKTLHGGGSSTMPHTSSLPAFPAHHHKNEDEEDNNEGNDDKNQEEEKDGK